MKADCNVIKDLLPLYVEGMLSKESKDLIEEHLENCPECTKEYNDLKAPSPADEGQDGEKESHLQEALPLKAVKKKIEKHTALIAVVSVAAVLAILVGVFALWYHGRTYPSYAFSNMKATVVVKDNTVVLSGPLFAGDSAMGFVRFTSEWEGNRLIVTPYRTLSVPLFHLAMEWGNVEMKVKKENVPQNAEVLLRGSDGDVSIEVLYEFQQP